MISGIDWSTLIFGSYSHREVQEAVAREEWQRFRSTLHGLTLEQKYVALQRYVTSDPMNVGRLRVQVTNYVNALKRGGLVR